MTAPAVVVTVATMADVPRLRTIMAGAIAELQSAYLQPDQVRASQAIMGLDTQLIEDGTYFKALLDGQIAGCGGWSWRATLYGGDHSTALRDARPLDPACDPAKVRAMYTDPAFARRGVGSAIMTACLRAAAERGFQEVELMATLAGEPLYRAFGFHEVEAVTSAPIDGVTVPLVRMRRPLP